MKYKVEAHLGPNIPRYKQVILIIKVILKKNQSEQYVITGD